MCIHTGQDYFEKQKLFFCFNARNLPSLVFLGAIVYCSPLVSHHIMGRRHAFKTTKAVHMRVHTKGEHGGKFS